jgi:hypothetical protein
MKNNIIRFATIIAIALFIGIWFFDIGSSDLGAEPLKLESKTINREPTSEENEIFEVKRLSEPKTYAPNDYNEWEAALKMLAQSSYPEETLFNVAQNRALSVQKNNLKYWEDQAKISEAMKKVNDNDPKNEEVSVSQVDTSEPEINAENITVSLSGINKTNKNNVLALLLINNRSVRLPLNKTFNDVKVTKIDQLNGCVEIKVKGKKNVLCKGGF